MSNKIITCETCQGKAEVFQESGAGIYATANLGFVKCPDCDGNGEIIIELEKALLELKVVCNYKNIDQYKNLEPEQLKLMRSIIAMKGYSTEKAYELSKYGWIVLDILKMAD